MGPNMKIKVKEALSAGMQQSIATALTQVKNLTRWVEEFAEGYTELLSKYKLKGALVVSPAGLLEGYMWSDIKNLTHDVHLTFGIGYRMAGTAKRAVGIDGIPDNSFAVGIQVQDEPSEVIPCAGISAMLGVIEKKFKEWTQE